MKPAALLIDFNGTLSDDEHIQYEIYREIFAEAGKALDEDEYFARLAGLSDPEIVKTWLGKDHPDVQAVIGERERLYRAATADGSTIHEHVREAVRQAAERVPLAICSGAARAEIEPVLEAAGVAGCFRAIVGSDDVIHGKPDPEGYLNTFALLEVDPAEAVVFEDTEAGIASARSAGVGRVLAVRTTLESHRLAQADELLDRIDVDVMRRLLL